MGAFKYDATQDLGRVPMTVTSTARPVEFPHSAEFIGPGGTELPHERVPHAAAFKATLETRQKKRAADAGMPFDRVAQVDLYFRFLDRVLQDLDSAVVLKGEVALEASTGHRRMRATARPPAAVVATMVAAARGPAVRAVATSRPPGEARAATRDHSAPRPTLFMRDRDSQQVL